VTDDAGYPLQNFFKWVAAHSDELKDWLDQDDGRESLVNSYLDQYPDRDQISQYEEILLKGNLSAITDALLKEGNPIGPCWVLVKG